MTKKKKPKKKRLTALERIAPIIRLLVEGESLDEILKGMPESVVPRKVTKIPKPSLVKVKLRQKKPSTAKPVKPQAPVVEKPTYEVPVYHLPVRGEVKTGVDFCALPPSTLAEVRLFLSYTGLNMQRSFGELLCLGVVQGIEHYWYQVESVKKILKYFRGRVLLCDEVGLGKTIEAGMLVKEYLMRGMAKNVLILTPPSLISQWQEEMHSKFGLDFVTTDDPQFAHPEEFWKHKLVIASLNLAKSKKYMESVSREFYDIVVVDEAHRVRNRNTQGWKLVNQIQKKFILLLTATPVQNNLIELYNLITLLKPGLFKTESLFKKEYVKKGDPRTPANQDKLRELLRDCLIRNTRSAINLKLPKRFATTMRLAPLDIELAIYQHIKEYLRTAKLKKPMVNLLLREAGSSPYALGRTLSNLRQTAALRKVTALVKNCDDIAKGRALCDILHKNAGDKVIVFAQYLKSVDYITDLLRREQIPHAIFRGDMTNSAKNEAIALFREELPVLVSTESGGEGRNLQFCRTIVNFDLPWNPMKIEQRIGRLHRIGQTRDVFIFNLAVEQTLEDYILEILDKKINMFEMVIGEIEPILGYISQEDDFENLILDIWMQSESDTDVEQRFTDLGEQLLEAKKAYLDTKGLDDQIFGEDYET